MNTVVTAIIFILGIIVILIALHNEFKGDK